MGKTPGTIRMLTISQVLEMVLDVLTTCYCFTAASHISSSGFCANFSYYIPLRMCV